MTKPKRPITRLWLISYGHDGKYPIVRVRKGPVRSNGQEPHAIRACTAKAAGRKAKRFLPHIMAGNDFETDNPCGPDYHELTPDMVKRYRKYAGLARVVVMKD